MAVEFGGKPCLAPEVEAQTCRRLGYPTAPWEGTANGFSCPLGQVSGRGHVLLLRSDLDALGLDTARDLVFYDGAKVVRLKSLVPVRAGAVTPGRRGDKDGACWLELADRRRLCRATVIDRAYNVRSAPGASTYYSATLNAGVAWTWAQLAADVWAAVGTGLLGAFPGLPFTPDGTPEGFNFYGACAFDALGVLLERLGCALKLDPITDTLSVIRLGVADAASTAALAAVDDKRVWDGEPLESRLSLRPEKVRVLFPRSRATPDAAGGSPYYALDRTDPSGTAPGIRAGTYVSLFDDLPALYDAAGALTNSAALISRAAERAADFFRRLRADPRQRVYDEALAGAGLRPGAQVAGLRWTERGPGEGLLTTLLSRDPGPDEPWDGGVDQTWVLDARSWQSVLNHNARLLVQEVGFWVAPSSSSSPSALAPGGRLSVSSADPAADGFSGGGGGVYYLPYLHDQVQLYVSGAWTSVPINTGVDASSGAHVNTIYDVFAYYDGAVMQLERLAWKKVTASNSPTSGANKVVNLADTAGLAAGMKVLLRESGGAFNEATAYVTAVVANTSITVDSLAVGLTTPDVYGYPARATGLSRQNGRLVKSGDATRLYLGTFYAIDGTDGPLGSGVYDSQTGRTLWNQYNRLRRPLKVAEATDSWSYNTATIRQANNSLANRVWAVSGMAAGPHLSLHLAALVSSTGAGLQSALIGDNSITAAAADCLGMAVEPSNYVGQARATLETAPGLGLHYYQWLERGSGAGTVTWYGDNGTPTYLQSGMSGWYDC